MYQLFNNQYKPTFGWVTFERLTETKRDVKLSVEILRRYYARSAMRLRNDHPLIQLMNNLSMNFQESLPEVQARLEAREVGVAFLSRPLEAMASPRSDVSMRPLRTT